MASVRLPPGCGKNLEDPLYYNEFQQRFQRARRTRYCLRCRSNGVPQHECLFLANIANTDKGPELIAVCPRCGLEANGKWGNKIAPRAYDHFLLLAGRGGGKTLIGAHAVREELLVPNAIWWALGPTYKVLHDSTFPTLVGLIPPQWVADWSSEHMEITLKNGAMVAFRSLEDPERARGPHGIAGVWFDEAAQSPERAYHVAEPMLIKAGGIVIASTTPLGFDWTYDQIEKQALVYKEPGFFCAKWWTEHNPMFQADPVSRAKIDRAKKTMTPEFYAQEYRAERSNAQGLIYGGQLIAKNTLEGDEQIKRYLPEWPNIDPSRKVLIGLDEGGDHPFGAVLLVITNRGIVAVDDYLKRMRAVSAAHDEIHADMGLRRFSERTYAANKNALNLRLEFGLKGTGVIQAENDQKTGIQRTQSWLLTGQLKFIKGKTAERPGADRTIDQMAAYRYADNTVPATGEKKQNEKVFKFKDELPDGVRYALMAWPELPNPDVVEQTEDEAKRLAAFDDKTRRELEIMAELRKQKLGKGTDLQPNEDGYPLGNVHQHDVADDFMPGW